MQSHSGAQPTIVANAAGLLLMLSGTTAAFLAWAIISKPSVIIQLYQVLSTVLNYL